WALLFLAACGTGCASRALDEPTRFEATISSGRAYESVTYGNGIHTFSEGTTLDVYLAATNRSAYEPLTIEVQDARLAWKGAPRTAQPVALAAKDATPIAPSQHALVHLAARLPQMKICGENPSAPSEEIMKAALGLSLRLRLSDIEMSLAADLDF